MAAEHADLFHHVRDFPYLELPFGKRVDLPNIAGFQLTKFMVLQVVAALIVLVVFRGLASHLRAGRPAHGRWWNFWEALALFIRDEVVRPTIGDPDSHQGHDDEHGAEAGHGHGGHAAALSSSHPADRYVPFVWSCFFYVLICNLLGAVPFLGSATGSLNVTGVLALSAMAGSFLFGVQKMGFAGFWLNLVPGLEIPGLMKPLILGLMFVIEVAGFFIKHGVLAVRLFANIMGGHTVLGVMLGFIGSAALALKAATLTGGSAMYWLIAAGSVGGQIGIGLLELFVAFLQAYVFAYLSTIFISMSVHHH